MSEKDLEPIIKRLDALIKLIAISTTGDKSLKEQVKILYGLGFRPSEISELLGKTPNHIRVTLHEIRRSKNG